MDAFSRYLGSKKPGGGAAPGSPGTVDKAAPPKKTPAPKSVPLSPNAFASTWPDRPSVPVPIGLRLPSQEDIQHARSEGSRVAWERHPDDPDEDNRVDVFNETLMRVLIARATCRPDDVMRPFWDAPEDNIFLALNEGGVRFLWEELENLRVELDAFAVDPSEEELDALVDAVTDGTVWGRMPYSEAMRARRLLRHCLAVLSAYPAEADTVAAAP